MTAIDRRQLLRGGCCVRRSGHCGKGSTRHAIAHAHGTDKKLGDAVSLDDRPFPDYDYTRANKLPREMTGYWEKSFDIGGVTRTAKIYISPETPIRSYYTVIAVPDGSTQPNSYGRRPGATSRTSERRACS